MYLESTVAKKSFNFYNRRTMSLMLAIETSCDETAAAILNDSNEILSNSLFSQINTHKKYGGVVPEVASRLHAEHIHNVIDDALLKANVSLQDLSKIAVTIGPGLEGCLLVGISVAKALSYTLDIPLIPVNHIHGHVFSSLTEVKTISSPTIALIVSGGHTDLIQINSENRFKCLGKTRDDAVGEVFDKVARFLNLGYPGGPIIEKTAKRGNPKTFNLPIAMKNTPYEFSFSGLKTATLDCINSLSNPSDHIADICASFQQAAINTLIHKSIEACKLTDINNLLIAGGVAANRTLISQLQDKCSQENITLISVKPEFCTDNAAMIGLAANTLDNIYKMDRATITVNSQLSYAV